MMHYLFLFLSIFSLSSSLLAVDAMTLEEKVGQLLVCHFHGEMANEEARLLIQKHHMGSVIYFGWANGLQSPKAVLDLSNSLQQLAAQNRLAIPLFIMIDQEGGMITRLKHGFTIFPGNLALGESQQPKFAKQAAEIMGQELKAVGINLNLAPVVDINNEPLNPVIGLRSFGSSPTQVTIFGKEVLEGYHQAKIITTLKHFPGHGNVTVDSHLDLPVLNASKEELEKIELIPFRELANQTDMIMTAHLLVPALDSVHCATLSPAILQGLLRQSVGFQGAIISDSMVMEGLLKQSPSVEEASIQALEAGCDLLILGGRQPVNEVMHELSAVQMGDVHQAIVQAVKQGRLSEERINQSVARILKLKHTYHLSTQALQPTQAFANIGSASHQQVAQQIAHAAVKVVQNHLDAPINLKDKKVLLIAPQELSKEIKQTPFPQLNEQTTSLFFIYDQISPLETEQLLDAAEKVDLVIVFAYQAWRYPQQLATIQTLIKKYPLTCVFCLGNPYDASFFQQAPYILNTYSPTLPSIQAAYDLFKNSLRF